RGRLRHGGGRRRLDLRQPVPVHDLPPDDLLDLSDALDALAAEDPAKAELVKLRFFGGLSAEEAAAALGGSRATADRHRATAPAPDDPPSAATDAHLPAAEAAGAVVAGRYKLLQPIGEGGMGTVWMAEQTEPVRRRVAVKLVRADRGHSATILARFEAERQA